jgi:hypothetical protein
MMGNEGSNAALGWRRRLRSDSRGRQPLSSNAEDLTLMEFSRGTAENRRKTGQEKGNVTRMVGRASGNLLKRWLLR